MDYLFYCIILITFSSILCAIFLPDARDFGTYILAIDFEVLIFLVCMFTIVAILNEIHFFQRIAYWVVERFQTKIRKLFYLMCLTSTFLAALIEDLSVAMIFGPIIIETCRKLKINPTPFLLGMTININLASTLTPFGSAENLLIANKFNLSLIWFVSNLGVYFILVSLLTLYLLDRLFLAKMLPMRWTASEEQMEEKIASGILPEFKTDALKDKSHRKEFRKNLVGLGILVCFLIFIPNIVIGVMLGLFLFTFLNPVKDKQGRPRPNLAYFFKKIDLKLVYFFICLFILVHLMELTGLIALLENLIEDAAFDNVFVLAVVILLLTSILSGFIDNAPVTVMFLPIMEIILVNNGFDITPLMIALILGINLGGNFLPQGSACDMMTLEISRQNNVDLTYKRLFKIGGLFACLHILLGICYLAFYCFVICT